jgi:hypothetical protein
LPPRHRYLVDLGAGYGESGSCSRNLLMEHGWRGLLMEPDEAAATELAARYEGVPGVVTRGGLVSPGDVEIVMESHGVPADLDLLVVGLQANDWYVWRAIADFRPSVVLIEYNAAFVPPQTMVIEYHPFNRREGTFYFGASIQSLANLGEQKGYELLYADSAGRHLFFVAKELYPRFGIADNSTLELYRGAADLPLIVPGLVWHHVDPQGRPQDAPQQVTPKVRIPRTYVFDEL